MFDLDPGDAPVRHARAMMDDATRTVRTARALVEAGRTVDVSGLDLVIDLLCARVLDLSPVEGRALRDRLMALRAEIDLLAMALGPEGAAG